MTFKKLLSNTSEESIAKFERMIGKKCKNWSKYDTLLFAYENNIEVDEYLKDMEDTYPNMPWEEFLALCSSRGFGMEQRSSFESPSGVEEEVILSDIPNGMIIYANSNEGKLHMGRVYCEAAKKPKVTQMEASKTTYFCFGNTFNAKGISFDVNRGMFSWIEELGCTHEPIVPWTEPHQVWFVNENERQTYGENLEQLSNLTEAKIDNLSVEVKDIMGRQKEKKY